MSVFIRSLDNPNTTSRKTPPRRDTSEACRERAAEDLLKSVTMLTANERLTLERSSASWAVRAQLLEGIECSAAERRTAVSDARKRRQMVQAQFGSHMKDRRV